MMTWTLYLLLLTGDGEWQAMEGRTYSQPKVCQAVASGLQGKPVGDGGVIVAAVCKEVTNT